MEHCFEIQEDLQLRVPRNTMVQGVSQIIARDSICQVMSGVNTLMAGANHSDGIVVFAGESDGNVRYRPNCRQP